jgi:hypothetical protein
MILFHYVVVACTFGTLRNFFEMISLALIALISQIQFTAKRKQSFGEQIEQLAFGQNRTFCVDLTVRSSKQIQQETNLL